MKRMLVSEKQEFPHQLLFFLGSDLTALFFWIASGKHSADSSPNSKSCVIISWYVKKKGLTQGACSTNGSHCFITYS